MDRIFTEQQRFQRISFGEEELPKGDYEYCVFANCIFAHSSISQINFVDCKFQHYDFSLANVKNTGFRDCEMRECKLLG